MKVLNRPMFRYGGPIKEGIMSGIKEPRQGYRDRPSLVIKNDPMKMQIDRLLTNQNNAANASKVFENVSKTIQDNKLNNNQVSNIENIFKNNNQFGNQDPNKIKNVTIEDKIQSYKPDPENPFRNIMDYTDKLNVYVDEDGVKRNRNTGKVVIDTETIETGKATGKEMPPMLDQSGKMGAGTNKAVEPDIKLPGDDEPKVLSRKEKVNSILEGLGYDRASKNALYAAMIKAGQRISRTGLGAENLVSDVIAETSQSYDKPEKLREAANLMQVQQDLKLDQIEASKSNKTEEDFNFYVKQFGGGEEGKKKALRMLTKDAQSETEAYLAAKKSTGSGLDGVKAGIEWMIRDGQIGANENKGEISKKSHDNIKDFVASDEFKRKGPGVYQLEGVVARIDANGSVEIVKSFGTISEKTNSWWGFGS